MSRYFITFGAGEQKFVDAGKRLIGQASITHLFYKLKLFTDDDLKNDADFWSKHSDFIENNRKGYGYWLWKPYIIMKAMDMCRENDVLVYADGGCEIDIRKRKQFNNVLEAVKTDIVIGCFDTFLHL
tara:strand:- start:2023 stop:2403 length:381 start_codon:yes stop_codon:yes gene_type:complete